MNEELIGCVSVPNVFDDLTTEQVLTSQMVEGVHLDKVAEMDQTTRNHVARLLLKVTVLELFEWKFMQTDPNWGNFLFDSSKQVLHLIDFGACRPYKKSFIDLYMELVWASANRDREKLAEVSQSLGFLTGQENEEMMNAHIDAGLVVGEPFYSDLPFDFAKSNMSQRLGKYGEIFAAHRLTPPPREAYSLHRKLAGAFLACIKLRATIQCRDILEETYEKYKNGIK
mmetsp:Transcript_8898/g.13310  ORF Transcript_8898/g.13310 Transcript_8898/m.13310 type:complete len:227 (-) Transcript_8898:31-711(-)